MEMNLDARAGVTLPTRRRADRLRRPDDLQQRHLADRLRRAGPGRGADLLLPEDGHQHLERLRRRQRHADRHRRRQPGALDARSPSRPTAARRRRRPARWRSTFPRSTNAVGAVTVPITGVALDVSGATQYGSQFGVTDLQQDGYAAGQLIGVQFDANGVDQRALLERRDPARRPARARHLPQPAGPAADGRQRLGADVRLGRPDRRRARATATSACCRPARSRSRTST